MVYLPVQNIQTNVVLLTNHVCVVTSEETTEETSQGGDDND